MRNPELRRRIFEWSGVERCVIQRDGKVRIYGTMPNTNQEGWYFGGWRDDLIRRFQEEDRADYGPTVGGKDGIKTAMEKLDR